MVSIALVPSLDATQSIMGVRVVTLTTCRVRNEDFVKSRKVDSLFLRTHYWCVIDIQVRNCISLVYCRGSVNLLDIYSLDFTHRLRCSVETWSSLILRISPFYSYWETSNIVGLILRLLDRRLSYQYLTVQLNFLIEWIKLPVEVTLLSDLLIDPSRQSPLHVERPIIMTFFQSPSSNLHPTVLLTGLVMLRVTSLSGLPNCSLESSAYACTHLVCLKIMWDRRLSSMRWLDQCLGRQNSYFDFCLLTDDFLHLL